MKKYKLKKWYPSLPNEWKNRNVVVKQKSKGYTYVGIMNNGFNNLSPKEVENSPEFWEPIKETYVVATECGFGYEEWNVFRTNKKFNNQEVFKYFQSKEKAQKYIEKNKPKYSKADIENALIKVETEILSKSHIHVYFDKFWQKLNS